MTRARRPHRRGPPLRRAVLPERGDPNEAEAAPVANPAGMPRGEATDLVRHMGGQHRLPDAIRRADTLARAGLPAAELTHRQHG